MNRTRSSVSFLRLSFYLSRGGSHVSHSSLFLNQSWFWYAIVFALHRIFPHLVITMGPYTWLDGLCRRILLFQFELSTHTQKKVFNSRISIWMHSKFVALQIIMLAFFIRFAVVGVHQATTTDQPTQVYVGDEL